MVVVVRTNRDRRCHLRRRLSDRSLILAARVALVSRRDEEHVVLEPCRAPAVLAALRTGIPFEKMGVSAVVVAYFYVNVLYKLLKVLIRQTVGPRVCLEAHVPIFSVTRRK